MGEENALSEFQHCNGIQYDSSWRKGGIVLNQSGEISKAKQGWHLHWRPPRKICRRQWQITSVPHLPWKPHAGVNITCDSMTLHTHPVWIHHLLVKYTCLIYHHILVSGFGTGSNRLWGYNELHFPCQMPISRTMWSWQYYLDIVSHYFLGFFTPYSTQMFIHLNTSKFTACIRHFLFLWNQCGTWRVKLKMVQ